MPINQHPNRRQLLGLAAGLLACPTLPFAATAALAPTPAGTTRDAAARAALARLERSAGGRLGVALLDVGSGALLGHRADDRFALCSTFKLPLVGAILHAVDGGRLQADQWVPLHAADRVAHAPVTGPRLAQGGMGLLELAEAAQTTSDNIAANVLLALLGGPAGLTATLRALGDPTTRLDRFEPHMNRVTGQDPRDTTSPSAMARTTATLLTSDWLSPAARTRLTGWMEATATGQRRLRAGLPTDWRSGDKTGTGLDAGLPDRINDVAIAWPPGGRAPLVLAAYYETAQPHTRVRARDEAVLAEVGRIATAWHTAS